MTVETITEKFDVMSNPLLKSLVLEAGAERVLNAEGRSIRLFEGDPRRGTLPKDPAYCSGQLFHALPRERGEVGLWFLAEGVIAKDPALAAHRDAIHDAIWDALPPCQHPVDYDAMPLTGGHPGDYPVPPAGPGGLKRQRKHKGFDSLIDALREKGEGQ